MKKLLLRHYESELRRRVVSTNWRDDEYLVWVIDADPFSYWHRAQDDFLEARFNQTGEMLRFQHGMLTPQANARFQQRLQRLLVEFAELHADCIQAPSDKRFGTSVLVALRPWEPQVLEALRRVPDARRFPTE